MICNYCRCEESDIIAEYTRFEKNNVLRCNNCGLVFLEIVKDKNEIESYYASEYRKDSTMPVQSPDEHYNDRVVQNDADNRVRFITKNKDIRGKRILEIGTASGILLDRLMEHSCKEVIGIELDEEYSRYAMRRNLRVLTRPIEELGFKDEFDAVVCFHTLEHVLDPMKVIEAIYTALKSGGSFIGEVPNQNDWRIQIFNDEVVKRFHYDPNHYYYYSPSTLYKYLEACGFMDIKLETVERYNSLVQLGDILYDRDLGGTIEERLNKHIFPKNDNDEVRLPPPNTHEIEFNRIFGKGVNSELMGNCLRWVAKKGK